MPRYDAFFEPFESFILSDDPDETGFTWNTRSAGNGVHTLQAVAKDAAGNSSTKSEQVTVSK